MSTTTFEECRHLGSLRRVHTPPPIPTPTPSFSALYISSPLLTLLLPHCSAGGGSKYPRYSTVIWGIRFMKSHLNLGLQVVLSQTAGVPLLLQFHHLLLQALLQRLPQSAHGCCSAHASWQHGPFHCRRRGETHKTSLFRASPVFFLDFRSNVS